MSDIEKALAYLQRRADFGRGAKDILTDVSVQPETLADIVRLARLGSGVEAKVERLKKKWQEVEDPLYRAAVQIDIDTLTQLDKT